MAYKRSGRKKFNSGTSFTTTNTKGGSRTRKTTSVKLGSTGRTKSRSVNKNGTVRLTTTHKSPAGWITRTVKTIGSKPSKPKAPRFIKAKSNLGVVKTRKKSFSGLVSAAKTSRRSSRSYSTNAGDSFVMKFWFVVIILIVLAVIF
jgi:hypothetical protein